MFIYIKHYGIAAVYNVVHVSNTFFCWHKFFKEIIYDYCICKWIAG